MSPRELVAVRRELDIVAPADRAIEVVQHLGTLPLWERKVRDITVVPRDGVSGTYSARGRLLGLVPWSGSFDYELRQDGFHSRSRSAIRGLIDVSGGFRVVDRGTGCTVIHYEHYRLPRWMRPIARLWERYIDRTMREEVERIATLAHPNPAIAGERVPVHPTPSRPREGDLR